MNLIAFLLITIEASHPPEELRPFTERLKKIIKVYSVHHQPAGAGLKKVGFYQLARRALNDNLWPTMQKYGAVLSTLNEEALVFSKTGSDRDLQDLYLLLEGPDLVGFCKSALIADEALNLLPAMLNP